MLRQILAAVLVLAVPPDMKSHYVSDYVVGGGVHLGMMSLLFTVVGCMLRELFTVFGDVDLHISFELGHRHWHMCQASSGSCSWLLAACWPLHIRVSSVASWCCHLPSMACSRISLPRSMSGQSYLSWSQHITCHIKEPAIA